MINQATITSTINSFIHFSHTKKHTSIFLLVFHSQWINSLSPGWYGYDFKWVNLKHCEIYILSYQVNTTMKWIAQDVIDGKSTLVQVMAWCHEATSHYLDQCWPTYIYILYWVSAGHSHHRKTRIGLDICENWVANFRRFGECKMPMQQHTNSRMLIKIWKC